MVLKGKKLFLTICSFFALSLISVSAYSQCDGSPGLPADPDDPTSSANCPLDTWVFALVILTIGYAVWQMRKQKKLSI
jgi:hypothetical protein